MPEKDLWFTNLKDSPECSDELLTEAAHLLSRVLTQSELNLSNTTPFFSSDQFPRILFVSLAAEGESARVYMGKGLGMAAALRNSYSKFWNRLDPKSKYIVKLDVVTKAENLGKVEKKAEISLQHTFEGIAFSKETNLAILPEQIFSNAIFNEKRSRINYENIFRALIFNPLETAYLITVLKKESHRLYSFKTKTIIIEHEEIRPAFRGHSIVSSISVEALKKRLALAASYLERSLTKNGQFTYLYDPSVSIAKADYSMTRHAGTVYAMLEYCQFFPDEKVLASAKTGLHFLCEQILHGEIPNSFCIVENGIIKLGAIALSILALVQYSKVTGENQYDIILNRLGNFILGRVQSDGRFEPHKESFLKDNSAQRKVISTYYPGEATLALLRLYSLDNNAKWLEAAEKAATWLITVRDKDKKDLYPDHWLLYALNELYRYKKQTLFIEHAKRLCLSILTKQINNSECLDWNGGYYLPPRSTPTATRGEGLSAAHSLFREDGKDSDFLKEILDTYKKIVLFEFSTQYLEESVMYFSDPQKSLGGFHASHTIPKIRIDYVQHNMSSLLGYYKIMTGMQ